jgi:hypothetical protein
MIKKFLLENLTVFPKHLRALKLGSLLKNKKVESVVD